MRPCLPIENQPSLRSSSRSKDPSFQLQNCKLNATEPSILLQPWKTASSCLPGQLHPEAAEPKAFSVEVTVDNSASRSRKQWR